MKRHFTSNYDIVRYNGKTNATIASYEKRNDRYHFAKLAKQKNYREIILANVLVDPNVWVGDIVGNPLSEKRYLEFRKRKESFTYHYERDLKKLEGDLNTNLKVVGGQYPPLLKAHMSSDIGVDTMCALNLLTKYLDHWDANIADTIVYPKVALKIRKFQSFISFDVQKIRKKTLDIFSQVY
jgi:hypothetical protein